MKNALTHYQTQQAIARAYRAFREGYPGWPEALFDEHFVQRLGLLLEGGLTLPDSSAMASWWAEHLGLGETTRARWIPELIPAACAFLELLRAELTARMPQSLASAARA